MLPTVSEKNPQTRESHSIFSVSRTMHRYRNVEIVSMRFRCGSPNKTEFKDNLFYKHEMGEIIIHILETLCIIAFFLFFFFLGGGTNMREKLLFGMTKQSSFDVTKHCFLWRDE